MFDQSLVGRQGEPVVWDVEKGHIRAFARALGETDPVYFDEEVARARGLRAIPAPATFAVALRTNDVRKGLDLDWRKLLHGQQTFDLKRPIFAGDRISVAARITEVGEKATRRGTMDLMIIETIGTDLSSGAAVFVAHSTILVGR